jgi:hypothetical protein
MSAIPTGDDDAQPEITIAPNQKAFKAKARVDKLEGTYDTDPAFTDFMAKLNKPPEKLSLAENVLDASRRDASSKEDLIKNNPLLKYMREKAERKLAERRSGKKGSSAKNLVVTGVLTKKSKQWVRACISHFERVFLLRFAPSWYQYATLCKSHCCVVVPTSRCLLVLTGLQSLQARMAKRAAKNAAPTAAAIRASPVTPPWQAAVGRRRDAARAAAVGRRAQLGEASSGRREARYGLILVLCVGNLFWYSICDDHCRARGWLRSFLKLQHAAVPV